MKLNRIISSLLALVILITSLVCVFPVSAFAEEQSGGVTVDLSNIPTEELTSDDVKEVIDEYLNYNEQSAEELLQKELAKGRLVSASAGNYTVYVNFYTGFVFYKNHLTGQILTSNPIDPAYQPTTEDSKLALMSQIMLNFSEKANSSSEQTYNSLRWIREGAFLEISEIEDQGIGVKYTLGDISEFFISPGVLLAETFREELCQPIFDNLEKLLNDTCGPFDATVAAGVSLNRVSPVSYKVTDHQESKNLFIEGEYRISGIKNVIGALGAYAAKVLPKDSAELKKVNEFVSAITPFFTESTAYSLIHKDTIAPEQFDLITKEVPVVGEGKVVYRINNKGVDTLRAIDKAIRTACPDYTKELADSHEKECGYNPPAVSTPFINVTIRYFLDDDGILTVDIPTDPDSLVFDEQLFEITQLTPLKYFGAGDMNNDGYIFYPDGSGTIVEYSDFYYGTGSDKTNSSIFVESAVFGNDYVYSNITGAHREQVTMPVYGMVNEVNLGEKEADGSYKKATNGFFTIIEAGASTASLCFESGGGTNKYAVTYSVIKPYPSDKYDLSQSLSVSGLGFYYVVAEKGYEGSYKYRINMLTDEDNAKAKGYTAAKDYYPSDYAGMASCYRNYLLATEQISQITEFSEDLPLYIEALGSMDIIKRILTFPVTVSTSLTTFEDVKTIYKELSDVTEAVKNFEAKAQEYREKAQEVRENNIKLDDDDLYIIGIYEDKAAHYDELADKVYNICNINFKLTGFANGGMYFTYPSKIKWESSVGGKKGFKDLVAAAKEESAKAGYNFGIFPDFDFLFINNTAAFDGIGSNSSAARMVDNRYASKQSYNSIKQTYESLFAIVLSTDKLDKLYTKFEKKYSKYELSTMSVATLGSVLNSNFDEDNIINRETALGHVTQLLDRMANNDNYSLMTEIGNIYSVKYVDHILNASIDSSHFRYSSFTVPFYGMVLHGYVNYAGSPLNYAGSPDYDILRSIENGASLYYILCYENTNHLKEDELLSQYYGIDYANWHENILENYVTVNEAIGDLQDYNINDHASLIAERIIDNDEMHANYQRLVDEFLQNLSPAVENCIDKAVAANPTNTKGYQLSIDVESVKAAVDEILSTYKDTAAAAAIKAAAEAKIEAKLAEILERFPAKTDAVTVEINKDSILDNYVSKYSYVTDSVANDKDGYKRTEFTCDNGSVVMVVYEKGDDRVVFLLNYNTFSVELTVDNTIDESLADGETKVYTLEKYGCWKLTGDAATTVKIK